MNDLFNGLLKHRQAILLGTFIGALLMLVFLSFSGFLSDDNKRPEKMEEMNSVEPKILYWVAPMDANYRRDKPGQSPMGMDLLPVYEQGDMAKNHGAGAITIAPHVINNLGVRTAPVERKSLSSALSTVGYVQYDEDNLIHIHPRVEGWVDSLYVKATGDPIKKGQALYTLYSPQLVNAQDEYIIALKRNNHTLMKAAKARLRALHLPKDFIRKLETNKEVMPTVTFYAPQSGVVDQLKIREGFYVKPGTTIMSIGKLEQVWIEVEVFERDAALIEAGLDVTITLDYLPAKTWRGVVDYVYPSLDPKTRTLKARVKLENPNLALKPNMFVQVDIQTRSIEKALLVPRSSVIRTGKQDRVVLALGDGAFKSIAVQIGRVGDEFIEVIDGVEIDDVVVVSAQFLIDSESSKTSDFMRMSEANSMNESMQQNSTDNTHGNRPASATVEGTINRIDTRSRTLNISRGAIEKWNREAATLDFMVADEVDISRLSEGLVINFSFEVRDNFVVVDIKPIHSHSEGH